MGNKNSRANKKGRTQENKRNKNHNESKEEQIQSRESKEDQLQDKESKEDQLQDKESKEDQRQDNESQNSGELDYIKDLCDACKIGDLKRVKYSVQKKVDLNVVYQGDKLQTPLH